MLSRRDIDKELGKGINITPLNLQNIKENSINLTIGQNAWCKGCGKIFWYGGSKFSVNELKNKKPRQTLTIKTGERCVFISRDNSVVQLEPQIRNQKRGNLYLLLMPHTTTIVETKEVIGVSNYIGGTLHSKVGIVAKGVGHIGTMLGPGFCGHLMISLHNMTDDIIVLSVGDTFVSLVLHYLTTQVPRTSTTISGHVDKFADLGINIDEQTRLFLTQDWKSSIEGIRDKMVSSEEFKAHKKHLKENRMREIKKYISIKNAIAVLVVLLSIFILFFLALYVDKQTGSRVWEDRFWNTGFSGCLLYLISWMCGFIKGKK